MPIAPVIRISSTQRKVRVALNVPRDYSNWQRFTDISTRLAREKCRHFYAKSRALLDADEPSLDTLQTLLMLSAANLSLGNEKKFYMLLGS